MPALENATGYLHISSTSKINCDSYQALRYAVNPFIKTPDSHLFFCSDPRMGISRNFRIGIGVVFGIVAVMMMVIGWWWCCWFDLESRNWD